MENRLYVLTSIVMYSYAPMSPAYYNVPRVRPIREMG